MDSIMRTIVDMDRQARERTAQAKQDLQEVDTQILSQSEAMRNQEQRRAKDAIEKIKAQNEEKLSQTLEDISRKGEEVSAKLDSLYAEKGKEWAKTLAERALKD